MSIMVARCGFNRNTKKEILFGPLELGGANFRDLYIKQGLGQILLFMKHWRSETPAGNLLRVALSWAQAQTGVSFPIMSLPIMSRPMVVLPHLEAKWLGSLREFLATLNVQLQVDAPDTPRLQRAHDANIMDVVMASERYTPSEIRRINYCRLYLKATTLADLATVGGIRLDPSKLRGDMSLHSSTTGHLTAHQERPSETEWSLWRKVNRMWSAAVDTFHLALGPWILAIHDQRQQHFSYWHHTGLWIRTNPGYLYCEQSSERRYVETTRPIVKWRDLPHDALPIEATMCLDGSWLLCCQSDLILHGNPPVPATRMLPC